jgi:hypothetical protein
VNKQLDETAFKTNVGLNGQQDGVWRGFKSKADCKVHRWRLPGDSDSTIEGAIGIWACFGCICVAFACTGSVGGACSAQGNTHITHVEPVPGTQIIVLGSQHHGHAPHHAPCAVAMGVAVPPSYGGQTSLPTSLPEGWAATQDPASGATYYYHATTGATSWEVPTGPPPPLGQAGLPGAVAVKS